STNFFSGGVMMVRKPLIGAMCAAMGLFAFGSAQAMSKVNVHATNLGRVTPAQLVQRLNLHAGNTLVADHGERLRNGRKLVRKRQFYNGVPVYGRSVVVERGVRGNVLRV